MSCGGIVPSKQITYYEEKQNKKKLHLSNHQEKKRSRQHGWGLCATINRFVAMRCTA
jgi:hypothetical protein